MFFLRKSKGQAWIQDGILALFIVITTVILFFVGYTNLQKEDINTFEAVYNKNAIVSEYLMLEGTPIDWNESNVLRIGIINSDNSINSTKLDVFYNMTINDYESVRSNLKTPYDFLVFFTDKNETLLNLTNGFFIGKTGFNNTNIVDKDLQILAKTKRYVIRKTYDGPDLYKEIISMNVYSWR
ncbi:hypothetical protein GOV05_04745 [Candidatus Woesearchaeota archaeon]|nr:hypothetical protein [Candidatus Woesearchaeota archaeon]